MSTIDLEAGIQQGFLEYFPGKTLTIQQRDGRSPLLQELSYQITDDMSKEEFMAYLAAQEQFGCKYYPNSASIVPVQMTPEKRQEWLERKKKEQAARDARLADLCKQSVKVQC